MNQKILLLITITAFIFAACSCPKKKKFQTITSNHKLIAILPIQSKILLKPDQKEGVSDYELQKMELDQGKKVQDAMEHYLVNKELMVRIQSSSITNSKLRGRGIDGKNIKEQDYMKLAQILGVDAVLVGNIETYKPMDDVTAAGLNIAKGIERSVFGSNIGGRFINTSTNKGACQLYLIDGKYGDRIWSYDKKIELGFGSTTRDIIRNIMYDATKCFPYKKGRW